MTADTLGGIKALVATNGAAVPPATYTSYTLGGSISGLTASGLVLADGTSTVAVPSGATSFTFGGVVTSNAPYAISVQAQPSGLTCSLANGSGNAGAADVGNVAVTCSGQSYTVGGTISGLTANGLVLANGSDTLNVAAGAPTFTMPRAVASGGGYAVTVQSQPAGQNCTVTNGTGTVGTSNVTNIAVSCSAANYTLSGTINGLTANGLVLANNGATVSPGANATSFTFGPVLTPGSSYAVSVTATPAGLTCSVANGSGTAGAANVSDVQVTCSSLSYYLGGSVSGLTSGASGLQLSDGAETLPVSANGAFQFVKKVAYGSNYAVSVATQPPGTTCSVSNATGTMPAADVTTVQVTCSPQAYPLSGSINGLTQAGLVLANGGDTVQVPANANSFTLPSVAFGSGYDVIVQTQPTGQNCTVQNPSGTMGVGGVTNVVVSCTLNSYNLKGTVNGLNLGGLLGNPLKLANGTDEITVPFGSSSFEFDKQVAYGSSYSVVVTQQPTVVGLPLLTCTVSNGSGVMGAGDVTNVYVNCQ
jgi:RNase P/RNase MRP subunit p29